MLTTGIKSKPVYAPLCADGRGRYHVILGVDAAGGRLACAAMLRVITELRLADAAAPLCTRVLCVPGSVNAGSDSAVERLQSQGLLQYQEFRDAAALLVDFRSCLKSSLMGTRLYVAGPESFIGLAMTIALEFNMNQDEIRAEEMGSRARRVYCVHCRCTTADVRTNISRCAGCERWLLVRDHYSRRLAAYMGVMVDAEAPGELPPVQEVYV